jgi:hypothetical protein
MPGQQLALLFEAGISIPVLSLQLDVEMYVRRLIRLEKGLGREELTMRPPNVSAQQVSTLSGLASLEHESTGSSTTQVSIYSHHHE